MSASWCPTHVPSSIPLAQDKSCDILMPSACASFTRGSAPLSFSLGHIETGNFVSSRWWYGRKLCSMAILPSRNCECQYVSVSTIASRLPNTDSLSQLPRSGRGSRGNPKWSRTWSFNQQMSATKTRRYTKVVHGLSAEDIEVGCRGIVLPSHCFSRFGVDSSTWRPRLVT